MGEPQVFNTGENVAITVDETPPRKIGNVTTSATLGAALATLITWVLATWVQVELPPGVEAALATLLAAIGSLIGGYLAKPKPTATITPVN